MKQLNSLLLLLTLCYSTCLLAVSGVDGGLGEFGQSFRTTAELHASVDSEVPGRTFSVDAPRKAPQAKPDTALPTGRVTSLCEDVEPETTVTLESCLGANDGEVVISPNGGDPGTTPYNINVYDAANMPFAPSCDGCLGDHTVTGLSGGIYTVTTDNVDTPCPQMASFTVDTRPSPT